MLEVAAQSLKKFRKVTKEIAKLSTGQKLVGGLVIAAAGLAYLATRETNDAPAPLPRPCKMKPNRSKSCAKASLLLPRRYWPGPRSPL